MCNYNVYKWCLRPNYTGMMHKMFNYIVQEQVWCIFCPINAGEIKIKIKEIKDGNSKYQRNQTEWDLM